jgi:16S rRNA (guanine966-N2)-methyltransferase
VLARGPAPAGGQDSTAPAGGQDSTAQDSTAQDWYDVVFADPPYALADAGVSRILMLLAARGWLAPGALVIVERASRSGPPSWPDGFVPDRARRYGEATFWYGLVPETAGERAR